MVVVVVIEYFNGGILAGVDDDGSLMWDWMGAADANEAAIFSALSLGADININIDIKKTMNLKNVS